MSEWIDVVLPADQVEGTRSRVQRWLKSAGDAVKQDEPLVEIETDKVTVEVPAPADGRLAEIVAAEGVDVEPGGLLGRLGPATAAEFAAPSAGAQRPAAPARVAAAAAAGERPAPASRRLVAALAGRTRS